MKRLALVTLAVAGCGTPLIPADVVHAPIFTASGTTTNDAAPMGTLRIAALWVDPLGQLDDRPWPPEGAAVRPGEGGAPASFELAFAAAPPPELIRRIPSAADPNVSVTAFAFAELVAFDDLDGDGTFHVGSLAEGARILPPDVYRGAATTGALFYVEEPDQPADIPKLGAVLSAGVGYRLADVSCDATTLNGAFGPAKAGDALTIGLGPAQADFPERRACLRSHVPPPAQ